MHQLDRAKHSLEFKTPCGALIPNPNETTSLKKYLLISISFALATLGTVLGQSHAYLWDPTTGIRDLGTLGDDSFAYAVNTPPPLRAPSAEYGLISRGPTR